eukprot:1137194-Pelagomonas_calceolata.AAC.3
MPHASPAVPEDFPVLYAGDVSELSQRLAVAFYDAPSRDLLVVGVTGSHGKTTVSWLIRGMLEEMEQCAECIILGFTPQELIGQVPAKKEQNNG